MSLRKLVEVQASAEPAAYEQKLPVKEVTSIYPLRYEEYLGFDAMPLSIGLKVAQHFLHLEEHMTFEALPTRIELRRRGGSQEYRHDDPEVLSFAAEPLSISLKHVRQDYSDVDYISFSGEPTGLGLHLVVVTYKYPDEDYIQFSAEPTAITLQEKKK